MIGQEKTRLTRRSRLATKSEVYRASQLSPGHNLRTPFPARQNRWELAQPEGPALGSAETESRAAPLEAPVALPTVQVASEDAPARLPRPILWLAFAGWVVCCGMLFITLVQREHPAGPERAWAAEPLLVATVSAALETVFGDPDRRTEAARGPDDTAGPPYTHLR